MEYLSTIPSGKINSIYAVDHGISEVIYACGRGIKYSSDFGATWFDFGLNDYEVMRLIYESTSLLAATRENGIFAKYHSTGDWEEFSNGFGKGNVIVDALNFTTWVLHVATENHSVYYLWLIINEAENDYLPGSVGSFKLSYNYPNPFNPTTKISWQSPVSGWQTLKVYDVLGNGVATLVNEYKPAGNYEVEFDASSLPSGVYFYQLKAGDFVQTNKMILLR